MSPRRAETTRKWPAINPLMIAACLAVIGWLGLGYLYTQVRPTLPARAAFLALGGVALMGTAWPVLLAIHRRFHGEPTPWTVWRQSIWVAAFGAACAWLQMNRLLNMTWAAILISVFVVIEVILTLRVRARQEADDD